MGWAASPSSVRRPAVPSRKRLAIEEAPAECTFYLGDNRLHQRVPSGERPGEQGGIPTRRPGFLYRLVAGHEAHVIEELVGTHRVRQKVLACTQPVAYGTRCPRDARCWDHAAIGDRP